jgi:hypothetical protein
MMAEINKPHPENVKSGETKKVDVEVTPSAVVETEVAAKPESPKHS